MNLSEMAAQVCADTGYLDTDDVTFAKQALRQRDDLLWRMGLWKDSLAQVNLTVDPENNEDHAEGVVYLPEVVDRVIAVRTADVPLAVSGLETFYRAGFDVFSTTGVPYEFAKLSPGWFTYRGAGGISYLFGAFDGGTEDDGEEVRAVWTQSDDVRQVTTDTVTNAGGPLQLEPENGTWPIVVQAVFKPATTRNFVLVPEGEVLGNAVATLAAARTRSPEYQRIRLLPMPTASTAIKVLAKAKYVPLDFDYAEPQITGSHLALMAFAKHSLRKRGGEHGAALDDLNEAMGLLETLKREEMQQEANNQRIIPASGYGDAFFGPGRDGFFVG